jgi:hypothetical protein
MDSETTFQQAWESYIAQVYPAGVTPEQRKELYQAFLGGGLIVLGKLTGIVNFPPQEGEKRLEAFVEEIARSAAEVMRIVKARN